MVRTLSITLLLLVGCGSNLKVGQRGSLTPDYPNESAPQVFNTTGAPQSPTPAVNPREPAFPLVPMFPPPLAPSPWQPCETTHAAVIADLYRLYLGRHPESRNSLDYWLSLPTIAQQVRGIAFSPESQAILQVAYVPLVRDVFGHIFHRLPQANEETEWVGRLSSGTTSLSELIAGMVGGSEYTGSVFHDLLGRAERPGEVTYEMVGWSYYQLAHHLLASEEARAGFLVHWFKSDPDAVEDWIAQGNPTWRPPGDTLCPPAN